MERWRSAGDPESSSAKAKIGRTKIGRAKNDRTIFNRRRRVNLFQRINRQTAEEFGIKVGGFLRQDFSAESDFAYLPHANRIDEKRDISSARSDEFNRLRGVAKVSKVRLFSNRFFRDS